MFRIQRRLAFTREQDRGRIRFLGKVAGDMEVAPVDLDGRTEQASLLADTEGTRGVTGSCPDNHTECLKVHDGTIPTWQEKSRLTLLVQNMTPAFHAYHDSLH